MLPEIRDRKIRVAVIGCGRISKNHFDSIAAHEDHIELSAVCDVNILAQNECSRKYKVKGYQNYNDLLIENRPDAVALCTPSGLHPDQTIQAAKAGVSIITEKPMATRWADGVRMVKACDENRVHLFVVKQNRRNATLQLLRRAIDEKRFGRINMVHLNVFWTRPQQYYDQGKWRGTWELDGGAFMNQASHYIDLLDWLVGPISDIQAMTSTHRDIEVEDTGVMNVRWRNGAIGSMAVTMCTYPNNFEGSITILGDKGTVRVGGIAANEIQTWDFEEPKDYDRDVMDANYTPASVYGYGHVRYYKNVIDVFNGTASAETDGREGLKSLEVIIGAYLSARDGKTISLPLEY